MGTKIIMKVDTDKALVGLRAIKVKAMLQYQKENAKRLKAIEQLQDLDKHVRAGLELTSEQSDMLIEVCRILVETSKY